MDVGSLVRVSVYAGIGWVWVVRHCCRFGFWDGDVECSNGFWNGGRRDVVAEIRGSARFSGLMAQRHGEDCSLQLWMDS